MPTPTPPPAKASSSTPAVPRPSLRATRYWCRGPSASTTPAATTRSLSVTELTTPKITVLSSGNPLPAPVVITPTSVPDTYAPDLGGKNIETTPITPSRSALDYWESLEGMRIEVDDAPVVGPSNSFGEQYVTTKPGQARTYRGGAELLGEDQIPSGRLEIVAPAGTPPVDVGDTYAGATVGPIDYSDFGGYTLAASTIGTVTKGHLAPVKASAGSKDRLSIATYIVENLAPGDPDSNSPGSPTAWSPTSPHRTSWRSRRCRTTPAPPTTARSLRPRRCRS